MALSVRLVRVWNRMRNENDFKDREIFGSSQDDDPIDWQNPARAFRGIKSADEGQRAERCPGFGTSTFGGRRCGPFPRSLQSKGRRAPPLFAIYRGVDRKRVGQKGLAFPGSRPITGTYVRFNRGEDT